MPRDRDTDKLRPDANEIAYRIAQAALGEAEKPAPPGRGKKKHPVAVKRGRKGGMRGGPARARKLSGKRRSQIARKGAKAAKARRGVYE